MIERGRGDVVLVTSEVARHPRPHMAAYVASKAGLEGFGDAMRMELEGSGVPIGLMQSVGSGSRVDAIAPGPIDTEATPQHRAPCSVRRVPRHPASEAMGRAHLDDAATA